MKQMLTILVLATLTGLSACGDDGLGGAFVPRGDSDGGPDLGPLYPIQPGDTFYYKFSRSYRPSTVNDPGTGLIVGEKQASGELCIKVTEVRDTATTAYMDANQTVIVTNLKVGGGSGSSEIVVSDQENNPADPAVVDTALSALWSYGLTVPSRGHGFGSPAQADFNTRVAPHPPNLNYQTLPFFDPRVSHDNAWGGWDFYDNDCATEYLDEPSCTANNCLWAYNTCNNKAENFLSRLLVHFTSNEGCTNFSSTDNNCDESHPSNTVCDSYTDVTSCNSHACLWDFAANNQTGACIGIYSFEMIWRDNITTGTGLQGDVLRKILAKWHTNGNLRSLSEIIVPDQSPSSPLPEPELIDCGRYPQCMTAELYLESLPWSQAYCTF